MTVQFRESKELPLIKKQDLAKLVELINTEEHLEFYAFALAVGISELEARIADLERQLAEAQKDTIPISDIESQIEHIKENGLSVEKLGGQMEQEGRCRQLCATYLREFINNFKAKQQYEAIDAAISAESKP